MFDVFILLVCASVDAYFYESSTFPECFGVECRNNGTLQTDLCTCQCPAGSTGYECEYMDVDSVWPDDNFALQETVFGCPEENVVTWRTLSVHLVANETLFPDRQQAWPALPHYLGPFHDQSIQLNFCVKTSFNRDENQWPPGRYCVYKMHPCSNGMVEEFLKLEGYTVQSPNVAMEMIDFMVEAYDDEITSVHFMLCCMNQETESTKLSNNKPFMMLKPSSIEHCQHIDGTEVKQEWFAFMTLRKSSVNVTDDIDNNITTNNSTDNNTIANLTLPSEAGNLNVSYCFYKPNVRTECIYTTDEGASYRGRVNVSYHGLSCIPWKNIIGMEYSSILEENYCRTITYKRLSCLVNIQEKQIQVNCDVDYCRDEKGDFDYIQKKYRNLAFYRPISTNINRQDNLKNIVNGLVWRGTAEADDIEFTAPGTSRPWITIQLGSRYLIHAVALYRNDARCGYPYKWTNVAVWIHTYEDQFESFGAHLCWEVEELLVVCNIELRCVQPLSGYYVTVQANINALNEDLQLAATDVNFEEIEVYGEETQCGQLFNVWEGGLYEYQMTASNGLRLEMFSFRNIRGCFQQELNITIDLLVPMTIEGVAVATKTRGRMKLYVQHENRWLNAEKIEEFLVVTENYLDIRHKYFREKMFARTVSLHFVTETESKVCVAFDLIGCPKMVERDPLCTKNDSVVGVSMETNTEIVVNNAPPEILTTTRGTNSTACQTACMNHDQCLTWNFSHDDDTCTLITASLYQNYQIGKVEISTVTKKEYGIYKNATLTGEKICAKEVRHKYPCKYEVTLASEPVYIASRNYPGPYLPDVHCMWIVKHIDDVETPVKVTFLDLDLVPPRNLLKMGDFYDKCTDLVSVDRSERAGAEGPHLVLSYDNATSFLGATTYMEESKNIYIHFITCKRKRTNRDAHRGFSIKIERSDCPGCKNNFSTCHDVSSSNTISDNITVCTSVQCGYISNLNYMGQSQNYQICRWYVPRSSVLQIEFLHFDIPSDDDCEKSSLMLYGENEYVIEKNMNRANFSESTGWYLISKFCNARKPSTVMYVATDIGLEYMAGSGTGFLLKWRHIFPHQMNQSVSLQTVNDGIENYCENVLLLRNYELFLVYPYKCYMRDTRHLERYGAVSWFTAADLCHEYGGKLIEVTNSVEEELIFQMLREYNYNSAFIGYTRNHTSGLVHDTHNNHITYINWGFDEEMASMEPNGLEESTCIMLKDILNPSSSSMGSKWADVNCYDTFEVLLICEKSLLTPFEVSVENRATNISVAVMNDTGSRFNDRMYKCNNGEYILDVLRCDQRNDCRDNSDEENCDYTTCGSDLFHCEGIDNKCIHINLTCDFYPDCGNATDEIHCVYPPCDENSWRCDNGQCIPANERLDKKYDCIDQSDEIMEGTMWTLGFETYNVFQARTTSNVFVKIYSESGTSQEMFIDRHNTTFRDGTTTYINQIIDINNPYKIRVKVDRSGTRPFWYLRKVTLVKEGSDEMYIFQCDCRIPALSSEWLTYKDISISYPVTLVPELESTIYTIAVVTGDHEHAGTNNNVYIALYGHLSDSGIFELKDKQSGTTDFKFQASNEDVFTFETPNLGDIVMVKVFHFGEYIYDEWFVEEISVHDSAANETYLFNIERWLGVNITDKDISVTFSAYSPSIALSYMTEPRCPDYMFECIDGQCIPQSLYCDQIVHCHGPFHEDEPLVCAYRHVGSSCADLLSYPQSREGFYDIIFEDDNKPYKVHCVSDENEDFVITRIHHNQESWMSLTDESNLDMVFTISSEGIDTLKLNSEFCQQTIEIGCFHVYNDTMNESIILLQNDGTKILLFTSWRNMSCDNDKSCQCYKTKIEWYSQSLVEFYIDEIVLKDTDQVPIVGIEVKKIPAPPSQLKLKIGSLDCFQRAIQPTEENQPCRNGGLYNSMYRCVLEYNAYMIPLGCTDLSHLSHCELHQCESGYVKCPGGYCIPLHYVCNGVYDCEHGEDEQFCSDIDCKGSLRCRQSKLCVSDRHICDGRIDCPLADDEMICDTTPAAIRSLSLNMSRNLENYPYLASLDLSNVELTVINKTMFDGLYNLLSLDLSHNDLIELDSSIFSNLSRLEKLKLVGNNRLGVIHAGAFSGLKSVKDELDLSKMKISTIFSGTFEGLESLQVLNLSHNSISELQDYGFNGMGQLEKLYLDGNPVTVFSSKVFDGLSSLELLVSDLYLLCCVRPSTVAENQCFPERDEFSSCDDLMRNEMLRYFVWIIGIFALFGNALALVYRVKLENSSFRTGNGVLLTNLCIADFIMGVYMLIIASADTHFRGEYVWNDIAWRRGKLCKLAGFLSFLSSEASGAFLCLITIDRWITIRYTLKRASFTKTSALQACLVMWAVCIFLAILPIFGLGYFDEDFYTKSGVCLALPLTTDRRGGWEYAVVIFVFLNFAMFVFIAVGQFLIFWEIHKANMAIDGNQKRDDVAIARKLLLIVMSNFLCWFPICIMGLIAMLGYVFDSEVYAWVAVFVLPLNSATNPILYTLSSIFTSDLVLKIKEKLTLQKNANHPSEKEEAEALEKIFDSGLIRLNYEANIISLAKYMEQSNLSLKDKVQIAKVLATALDLLHTLGYVAGPFSTDEVLIRPTSSQEIGNISLMSIPLYSDTIDDISNDIANLGLIIKKMTERPKHLPKRTSKRSLIP